MGDDQNMGDFDHEPELMEAEVFGHKFSDLPGLIEDLITLEKEGAIYAHFWDEQLQSFRYNRIKFLPKEIYQYVEAHIAKREFDNAMENAASFEEALSVISDPEIAERVRSYGNFGKTKLRDGSIIDNRGCAASFYPKEIQALVCGKRPDRYEILPNLDQIDKKSMIIQQIDYFPILARYMANRGHRRPPFKIENEYDVQDFLFVCIRSILQDARIEDWTPKHAGSSKRIDIVVPSVGVLIETKCVRDASHARKIGDELRIDIESYHSHPSCKHLIGFIYDPSAHIIDPDAISNDLSGPRSKGTSHFDVQILVRR